ncbi:hypothetical protein HNR39_004147 [Glaciimonas immobilis]|uniref:Uncharacterized protein n=1 Tax=Glaciimonas immobilis TaxID=728004 RepID=A0A840RXH6_9BURK|nr:hypothetical protein [Glaciimonas immobilis]
MVDVLLQESGEIAVRRVLHSVFCLSGECMTHARQNIKPPKPLKRFMQQSIIDALRLSLFNREQQAALALCRPRSVIFAQ